MLKKILYTLALGVVAAGITLAAWPWRNYVVPLNIGIEGNFPPFTKTEADGSVSGFEVDLAGAYCEAMRARCNLVTTDFDALIPQLKTGQLDAAIASLTITPDRQKDVDFSSSYYNVPSAWIAPQDGRIQVVIPGMREVKAIAVLKGSPRETWLRANFPEVKINTVEKETDIYAQLLSKEADLGFSSLLVAKIKFLSQSRGQGYHVVGNPIWLGNGVGVAVQKGNGSLQIRFNKAIRQLSGNGVYRRLASRYFDFDINDGK